jgi:hypothetical protein
MARQVSECYVSFTPTNDSWLDQMKIRFGIITRQAIKRGTFTLRTLTNTVGSYIKDWNHDAKPFTWTTTPNKIITKLKLLHRDFKKLLA